MPQSLSSILIHLIFSTKNREPFIKPAIESELPPYMAKIFRAVKSPSLAIDGTNDHIHILFCLGRVMKIADLLKRSRQGHRNGSRPKGPSLETFIGRRDMAHSRLANQTSRP